MLKYEQFLWLMNAEMSTTIWTKAVKIYDTSFWVNLPKVWWTLSHNIFASLEHIIGYVPTVRTIGLKQPPSHAYTLLSFRKNQKHWLLKGPKWYFLVSLKPSSDYSHIRYFSISEMKDNKKISLKQLSRVWLQKCRRIALFYHFCACDQLRFLSGPEQATRNALGSCSSHRCRKG